MSHILTRRICWLPPGSVLLPAALFPPSDSGVIGGTRADRAGDRSGYELRGIVLLRADTVRGFKVELAALRAPKAAQQIDNRRSCIVQHNPPAAVIAAQGAAAYRAKRTVEIIDCPRTVRPFFLPVSLHNQHIRKRPLSFLLPILYDCRKMRSISVTRDRSAAELTGGAFRVTLGAKEYPPAVVSVGGLICHAPRFNRSISSCISRTRLAA